MTCGFEWSKVHHLLGENYILLRVSCFIVTVVPLTRTEQLCRSGDSPAELTWGYGQVIGVQMVFEVPGKAPGLRWW